MMSYDFNNIPKTIKIVLGLLYLRVVAMLLILLFGLYAVLFSAKLPSFIEEIASIYLFELDFSTGLPHNLGIITGALFLPTVIIILQLVLVKQQRNYPILLILVILGIITSIVRQQLPILGLMILILLTLKSSRTYFQIGAALRERKRVDILDDF